MSPRHRIVAQFRMPSGIFGRIAGWIMANRASNRARNRWTVELLDIAATDHVVKIGCGPGYALALCAARATAGMVVGLDHSEIMIDQARRRNRAAIAAGRMEARLGGVDALTALTGPFDKAFSVNVVQFLPDKGAAFHALFAAMAKGGLAATTYMPREQAPTRANARIMADTVAAHMAEAGFADIRIEELALEPAPAIAVLGRKPV